MRPSSGGRPSRKRDGGDDCAKSDASLFCGNHQPDAHMYCSQKQASKMIIANSVFRPAPRIFLQHHHTAMSRKSVWADLARAIAVSEGPGGNSVAHVLTGYPASRINTAVATTQQASSSAPIAPAPHRHDDFTSMDVLT